MRELLKQLREGKLKPIKKVTVGTVACSLVYQGRQVRCYRGEDWKAAVNTDDDEKALKSLQKQIEHAKEARNDTLPLQYRSGKLL